MSSGGSQNVQNRAQGGIYQSSSQDGHFEFEAVFSDAKTIRRRINDQEGGTAFGDCPCAGMRVLSPLGNDTMYWGTVSDPPFIDRDYVGDTHGEPIVPNVWVPIPLKNLGTLRIVGTYNQEIHITIFNNTTSPISFDTSSPAELTPPTIVSHIPAAGATGVQVSEPISIVFSEAMDPEFFTSTHITVSPAITATYALDTENLARGIITPTVAMAQSTLHTVTVKSTIRDAQGDEKESDTVFSFTTGVVDVTAPTVSSRFPANGATGVDVNVNGTITFNEAMKASTINNTNCRILLTAGSVNQAAAVTLSADLRTVTINPNSALAASSGFTLRATTGVQDLAGNALAAESNSTFTTGAVDTTAPIITNHTPDPGETGVSRDTNIIADFNEAMNTSDMADETKIKLKKVSTGSSISVSLSFNSTTHEVTMNPDSSLDYATEYEAKVEGGSGGVRDLAGNLLAADNIWTFTTEAAPYSLLYSYSGDGSSWTDLNHNPNDGSGLRLESNSRSGSNYLYETEPHKVVIKMRRVGSPGGTITCKIVFDDGGAVDPRETIGTMNANDVTTSSSGANYTFENATANHNMHTDDCIIVDADGAGHNSSNYIQVRRTDADVWDKGILIKKETNDNTNTDTGRDFPADIYGYT